VERLYKCRLCHRAKHLRGVVCPIKKLSVSAPHLGEAAAAAAELTSEEALRRVLLDGVPFLAPAAASAHQLLAVQLLAAAQLSTRGVQPQKQKRKKLSRADLAHVAEALKLRLLPQ